MKKRTVITPEQLQEWFEDKKNFGWTKKIVYGQFIFTGLLILAQLVLFFLFVLRFNKYTQYFLGGSLFLSFFFMVYLVNTRGKNEFKIAWMLPLVIFPLFGIGTYIMFHTNRGGTGLKKKLAFIKKETKNCFPSVEESEQIIRKNPEWKDLCSLMLNTGNYPPYTSTELKYLKNGEEYLSSLLTELRRAREYIFMEYFIIVPDESWMQILDVLEERAKAGVEVRVLFDGFGSLIAASKFYVNYLESRGIKAHIFLKMIPLFSTKLNNRDHRKITVIDGITAFTGGINLANEYFNIGKNRFPYWKDNGVILRGSAVQTFTTMFLQNWYVEELKTEDYEAYVKKDFPQFSVKGVCVPYGDDAYNNEDVAEDLYISLINKAKNYVYITSPYLVVDNHLFSQMILAAKQGVDINFILPSMPDHFITFCMGRLFAKKLIENGIKVYFYNKGFIHSKIVISDGKAASVGSVNFDYRSFYHHFECGLLMCDSKEIGKIEEDFQETLKDCTLITEEEYKKIPKRQLFIGWLFRIFAPLM